MTIDDWSTYRAVWSDLCGDDPEQLEAYVAVALDDGGQVDVIRTNVKNACPDRLADFEAAFDEVRDATDLVEGACATPEAERTDEQSPLAEAMGC